MATAQAYLSIDAASDVSDLSQGGTFAQQVVKSYVGVASTQYVLGPVVRELSLPLTPSALARQVVVSAPTDQTIITVTAEDRSAGEAATIANAVTRQLGVAVVNLSPAASSKAANVRLTQIEVATPSVTPSSPNPTLYLTLGTFFGILSGCGLAFLVDQQDSRVRTGGDAKAALGVPLLGIVSFQDMSPYGVVVNRASTTRADEEFRELRTNLRYMPVAEGRASTLLVTSAAAGEGKSTTIANLAVAAAFAGRRVLLIDADLRRPQLANLFGLDGTLGLSEVLIGGITVKAATQRWSDSLVNVLPAGTLPPNPSELLQSAAFSSLVRRVQEEFDLILIDSPPLLAVTDPSIIAPLVDATIMIVGARQTKLPQIREALEKVIASGAHVGGMVVTKVRKRATSRYAYQYASNAQPLPADQTIGVANAGVGY